LTAEIAVLNAQAVALAADSAVTIETTTAPADAQRKVYNTVNKLFALSKYEPVGIMVYGNASIAGLPAETVIKQFRMRLGSRAFPTAEGYVEGLAEFLARERLCSASEEEQLLASVPGSRLSRAAAGTEAGRRSLRTVDRRAPRGLRPRASAG
jgi:hypothetical protein